MKKKTKKTTKKSTTKMVTRRNARLIKRAPARKMKQLDMFPSVVNGKREKRTSPLMVRFTPEQYAFVRHHAAMAGQDAAAFIRSATLHVVEASLVKMKPAELAEWKRNAERAAAVRSGGES